MRLDGSRQHRLFGLVEEEAAAIGVAEPAEIRATMEVGAALTETGDGRRVLTVGLPLLHLLSERGLRGLLARELARAGAPSRPRELEADGLAARRAGRAAFVAALRRSHGFAPLFEPYWRQEVVPVLEAGRRPQLARGFGLIARTEAFSRAADEHLAEELGKRAGPTAAYPSLAERLAALGDVPVGDPDASGPAAALIVDPDLVEGELAGRLFGPEAARGLEPLSWEDVTSEVTVPGYARLVNRFPSVVEGITLAGLPGAVERLTALARRLREQDGALAGDEAARLVVAVLCAGAVLGLREAGWAVHRLPGAPACCERDGHAVVPLALVRKLREREFELDAYWDRIADLGIGGVRLDVALREGAGDAPGSPPAAPAGEPASGPAAAHGP